MHRRLTRWCLRSAETLLARFGVQVLTVDALTFTDVYKTTCAVIRSHSGTKHIGRTSDSRENAVFFDGANISRKQIEASMQSHLKAAINAAARILNADHAALDIECAETPESPDRRIIWILVRRADGLSPPTMQIDQDKSSAFSLVTHGNTVMITLDRQALAVIGRSEISQRTLALAYQIALRSNRA